MFSDSEVSLLVAVRPEFLSSRPPVLSEDKNAASAVLVVEGRDAASVTSPADAESSLLAAAGDGRRCLAGSGGGGEEEVGRSDPSLPAEDEVTAAVGAL